MVPRFGITQGGKVRAVDHFSWSHAPKCRKRKRAEIKYRSVNGHYEPDEDMKHDHLDDLVASMKLHYAMTSQVTIRGDPALCEHFRAPFL